MGRKSAKIANKKGANDKARSKIYTKVLHDVGTAAKNGGGDIDNNFLLRVAVERCKKCNVPKDNIDRAIKRGIGGDSEGYEDVTYEGYGPGGVAIFIETSTNNTTRTIGNLRSYFTKCNGSIGKDGCLQFIFDRKAVFLVPQGNLEEDNFTMEMIEAGAEDITLEDELYEIIAPMEMFGEVQKKLQSLEITPDEAGLERIPNNFKEVDEETLVQLERLIDMIEDDDDVVSVYNNLKK